MAPSSHWARVRAECETCDSRSPGVRAMAGPLNLKGIADNPIDGVHLSNCTAGGNVQHGIWVASNCKNIDLENLTAASNSAAGNDFARKPTDSINTYSSVMVDDGTILACLSSGDARALPVSGTQRPPKGTATRLVRKRITAGSSGRRRVALPDRRVTRQRHY
jgi:hypothetical protein